MFSVRIFPSVRFETIHSMVFVYLCLIFIDSICYDIQPAGLCCNFHRSIFYFRSSIDNWKASSFHVKFSITSASTIIQTDIFTYFVSAQDIFFDNSLNPVIYATEIKYIILYIKTLHLTISIENLLYSSVPIFHFYPYLCGKYDKKQADLTVACPGIFINSLKTRKKHNYWFTFYEKFIF